MGKHFQVLSGRKKQFTCRFTIESFEIVQISCINQQVDLWWNLLLLITDQILRCADFPASLLWTAVRRHAVLLSDGRQLLQELGKQDDGEHSALGLRGDGGAGRQDTEGGQRQGVPHRAVGSRRIQDDVSALRLERLWEKVWENMRL